MTNMVCFDSFWDPSNYGGALIRRAPLLGRIRYAILPYHLGMCHPGIRIPPLLLEINILYKSDKLFTFQWLSVGCLWRLLTTLLMCFVILAWVEDLNLLILYFSTDHCLTASHYMYHWASACGGGLGSRLPSKLSPDLLAPWIIFSMLPKLILNAPWIIFSYPAPSSLVVLPPTLPAP